MHAMQGDWSRTVSSYRRSLEGFEAVCSKKDKRITEVSRLLKASMNFLFLDEMHFWIVPWSLCPRVLLSVKFGCIVSCRFPMSIF